MYKVLLILIIFANSLFAQQIIPVENKSSHRLSAIQEGNKEPNNVYYKDVNNVLNKYVNEWIFDNGEDYVKIKIDFLENVRYNENLRSFSLTQFNDLLSIRYQYIRNGIEVYNNLEAGDYQMLSSSVDIFNKVSFTYVEPPLNDSCEKVSVAYLNLTYNESNPIGGEPSLTWERKYYGSSNSGSYPCPDGSNPDTSGLNIPEIMTFTSL